jgi:hypothetical protein
MNTPSRHEGTPASIRRSKRLIARTKAISAIASHVSDFEGVVTSLESRYDEWNQARHQLTVTISAQHEAEEALDQELRGVGLAILTASRGRRSSEIYLKYFPEGYGSALNHTARESLAIAAGLLEAMNEEAIPVIQACRVPLESARALLDGATAQRQAAEDALSRARANLEEEKLAWRKAYSWFYFMARSIFSDRRGYVESLFRVTGKPAATEEDSPEENPAVADGGEAEDEGHGSVRTGAASVATPIPMYAADDPALHTLADEVKTGTTS